MVYDNHINENKLSLSVYPSIDLPSSVLAAVCSPSFQPSKPLSFHIVLGTVPHLS
jgi:hypothetical protein